MAQNKNLVLLNAALVIFMIVSIVYGLGYAFFPKTLVSMSGGDPIPSTWLRWSGGVLIALGIGTIMVFRNPARQKIFVITIALGTLFTGLALLYSWIFEPTGKTWFTALPAIITLVLSGLLWWGLKEGKETLG
jgi:uncharacterized protein YjeT (DUF2065 family)